MKYIRKHIGKLSKVKRLKNSLNGNPRFLLAMVDENQNFQLFRTAVDSGLAYSVENYLDRDQVVEVEIGQHYGKPTLKSINENWDKETWTKHF
tara:strand:+ start:108 stop:386 length:279 start_codon:yes stop_codon:yes gene_type:complete